MTTSTIVSQLTGRPPMDHGGSAHGHRVLIGNAELSFHVVDIDDPVPTGRQILEAAGALPTAEHLVFQVLPTGLLEELRQDKTTDLRSPDAEKFLVFRSDRSFRFDLNGRVFEWGATTISGRVLRMLAGIDESTQALWQDRHGSADIEITDSSTVDLATEGTERFYTALRTYTIIVNTQPTTVNKAVLSFIEVVRLAFPQATPSATMVYTVTYKKAAGPMHQGSLTEGEHVTIKNGTIINVTETDKS
jgi:Multiubiquitin